MRLLVFLTAVAAANSQAFHKLEIHNEKTPYDYVKERLDSIGMDPKLGMPLSGSYEVEESEDYPDKLEEAASIIHNNVGGVGGVGIGGVGVGGVGQIGLGQGLGYGGLGGVGLQGLRLGYNGVGLNGVGGVGLGNVAGGAGIGVGGAGIGVGGAGYGVGGIGQGGIGLIHPGLAGIGAGGLGLGGVGGGYLYHPLLGQQVGGGYVDKKAYDEAQKKGADENVSKLEKQAEEVLKKGQEGYQQASAAAAGAQGDSSFYKGEEAKKKAAGDEKFYEGGQKFDKQGANEELHKTAKSHKKGHVSKGFKSSSSKNEEEKSESFYDEAHDEGDHKLAGQNAGSFGENAQQGFKGAHEEKILDANAAGKEGHHVVSNKFDDSKANKGEFLQKDYNSGAEQLEKFNNLGAHSVHGHQEAAGGFQQSKGILPIHHI